MANGKGNVNKTISVNEEQFREFKALCAAKGRMASDVIDELIAAWVKKHKVG